MAVFAEILRGFGQIFSSPFKDTSALWLIVPLFLLWIVLVVYFGVYSTEKLGWNTALGNGISMFWVFVSLLSYLFSKPLTDWTKVASLLVLFSYALFIVIVSFKHAIKESVFFVMASPTVLFFFSWIAVVWTYGSLALTWAVLIDLVVLLGLALGAVQLLTHFRAKTIRKKESAGEEGTSEESGEREPAQGKLRSEPEAELE